jgi:hypothetical protein
MVTFDSIYDSAAVANAAVKLVCTCEDVDHGAIIGANVDIGAVEGCIKECVFYSKVVRKIKGQEVGATNIPTGRSMWAKNSC